MPSTLPKKDIMKEPINRWQLVISIFVVFVSMLGFSNQWGRDYAGHEERIKRLEDDKKEIKTYIEKVESKVDAVSVQGTQILILLQNKQDRK